MDSVQEFKDTFLAYLEYILTPSPTIFITGALIILLVPVLFHYILVRSSPYTSPPTVLLVGGPGSGKTSLISLLERGPTSTPPQTHTSQTAHSVELSAPKSRLVEKQEVSGAYTKFLLVDTPGHGKLRQKTLARLTPSAIAEAKTKAVVFVVDASSIAEHDALASTASYLYDVLLLLQKRTAGIKTSKIPSAVPLLIAANKLDLFTALPAALVKANLEAEISRIRVSKSKGLLDSGVGIDDVGSEEHDDWLGSFGTEKFTFDQMREFNVYVDVLGGNVVGDGPGVDKWWKWIAGKV
ncbi:hypothetical protein jhhlp_001899 [Lomentospora prolificans]|uniref:Signal recognition particle receptor subunit beta n=1 Tax=Lomentospora prolificans TaxID=41688 RepID=A0A2N3NCJ9_9PEZI|nr:hypothetical protein jhhlp_001899 [Lomentospora prolificans]